MLAQRDNTMSVSTTSFMSSKDQRTSRFLSCFAIFLLRMYESSIVLAWVKRLQRMDSSDNDEDEEDGMDTKKAALLHKWVAARHESLMRTWATRLQLSTLIPTTTTAVIESTTPSVLSVAIPKMHGRTLTWEGSAATTTAAVGDFDEAEASSSSAGSPTSASIEAYSSDDDDNDDDSNDTDITEDTESDPPLNCTYTDTSLTRTEITAETIADEQPRYQVKEDESLARLLPPTFHEDEDDQETERATDDSPFGPDALVILPSQCPSVPTIVLTPPLTPTPTPSDDAWDTVQTPTQYSMWGNRLVVPGFRCYDDESVRPGVWQKWEDEEDEDVDVEINAGTDEDDADSEVDDDERNWTYHPHCGVGSTEEEAIKTRSMVHAKPAAAKVEVEDVRKTFWIDEDEEDLPDLPSDWA